MLPLPINDDSIEFRSLAGIEFHGHEPIDPNTGLAGLSASRTLETMEGSSTVASRALPTVSHAYEQPVGDKMPIARLQTLHLGGEWIRRLGLPTDAPART